jgi:hypothetical protein
MTGGALRTAAHSSCRRVSDLLASGMHLLERSASQIPTVTPLFKLPAVLLKTAGATLVSAATVNSAALGPRPPAVSLSGLMVQHRAELRARCSVASKKKL